MFLYYIQSTLFFITVAIDRFACMAKVGSVGFKEGEKMLAKVIYNMYKRRFFLKKTIDHKRNIIKRRLEK